MGLRGGVEEERGEKGRNMNLINKQQQQQGKEGK